MKTKKTKTTIISRPDYTILKGNKHIILLTADIIGGPNLWSNGLHQNCLFLYNLFEIAGYFPVFLLADISVLEENTIYRATKLPEFDKKPYQVYALIEIGLNCSSERRTIFRKYGSKIFKLFLGNILNIDIEKPICTEMVIEHHIADSHGTMLLSPHYHLLQEYSSALYNVYPNAKIAPYVWESSLIQDLSGIYCWPTEGPYSFTIMEPNISFQKCSLIPIMICEAYYRSNPGIMDGVVVVCGNKLVKSQYFLDNIISRLDLYKDQRLFFIDRLTIRAAATSFKQNIIICHTVNNEYNYLFLEYLFMGFPVIHNYTMLKEYGYYYKGNDIEAGKNMIKYVINTHGTNLAAYQVANQRLFRKFSINNPENIKGWCEILQG